MRRCGLFPSISRWARGTRPIGDLRNVSRGRPRWHADFSISWIVRRSPALFARGGRRLESSTCAAGRLEQFSWLEAWRVSGDGFAQRGTPPIGRRASMNQRIVQSRTSLSHEKRSRHGLHRWSSAPFLATLARSYSSCIFARALAAQGICQRPLNSVPWPVAS